MAEPPRFALLQLAFGYMGAQLVHVAAQLGLADHLAAGPATAEELAERTGAHPPSLHRLLRALACNGLVSEAEPGRFELAEAGRPLRADAPDSVRDLVLLFCGEQVWRAWGELGESVRTGEAAWHRLYGGTSFAWFQDHPEESAAFNAAMAEDARNVAPAVAAALDAAPGETVVDVGGGTGTLLGAVLAASPGARGVLFDLPAGVEGAEAVLGAAGVADRCEVVTGDFFDAVPGGADAYLLKSVLHDWDDERAAAILAGCRRAMAPSGRVAVVEVVMPERIEWPLPERVPWGGDLNMLVNTGGKERTEAEWREVFGAAGLELTAISDALPPTVYRLLEARPLGR